MVKVGSSEYKVITVDRLFTFKPEDGFSLVGELDIEKKRNKDS